MGKSSWNRLEILAAHKSRRAWCVGRALYRFDCMSRRGSPSPQNQHCHQQCRYATNSERLCMTFMAVTSEPCIEPVVFQINGSTGEISGHITASRSCCCGFIACYNNCCCAGTNDVEFEVTASNNRLNESNSVTGDLKVQIQESVWHDNGWTRAVKHCLGKQVCQPNFCMWTMLALYHVSFIPMPGL